jgi:hypothetical protein
MHLIGNKSPFRQVPCAITRRPGSAGRRSRWYDRCVILPDKSGTPLNPFNTPYAVAPLDLYSGNGGLINPGDDATVIANGTVQDAPVGDFGPTGNGAGEGSPALWDNAGVPWQPTANGPVTTGADTPVTVIYWPTVGPH